MSSTVALLMALILSETSLGESQLHEAGTSTCDEQQQALIEQFRLAVVSQIWYPTCLPGGYFRNVQCSFNHCFCAYLDTGKEIENSRRGKSAEELVPICPWVSKEPPAQCSLPPKSYPCNKRLERYYYNPKLKKCDISSSSCLGFSSLAECEITCGIYKPPPIRCVVGEVDASKGGKCVRSSAGSDKKKCIICGCEEGHVLSRNRSVCFKARWKRFSCKCEYDGLNEIRNIGPNITKVVRPTGEIILRCNAPDGVTGISWSLNRIEFAQNCESDKYCISKNGRYLNLWDADYTYSGIYKCQFVEGTKVQSLASVIVIPATVPEACGQSPGINIPERATPPRILGGTETKLGMAPFVVQLLIKGSLCGGSLISHRYVVTAARCAKPYPNLKNWVVKLGKLSLNPFITERYEQAPKVKRILTHEDDDEVPLDADIALVELEEPVYFSHGVKPICIPYPHDTLDEIQPSSSSSKKKKFGLAFGWGVVNASEREVSDNLKEVSLPIISREKCQKKVAKFLSSFGITGSQITDLMVCAGGKKNKDTCDGDTGGPLALWSEQRNRWYLGGITSFGPAACGTGIPGIYTKIAADLRQWIYNNSDLNLPG